MSIPVRNIWWLMLYASDLGPAANPAKLATEDLPEHIPDLVAEVLARAVEQRQRRQLSTAFLPRQAVISRVRGRIDHLTTERHHLLAKGQVACRFEELGVDSPRNRYVRTALDTIARLVQHQPLAHRCRALAAGLRRQGVVGEAPGRSQISTVRFGRHDQADQPMLAAARLAMDLLLPAEEAGPHALLDPTRCVHWLRRLYEKAIGGFYRVHLDPGHWQVRTGRVLSWPIEEATDAIAAVFPSMRTDIVLDRRDQHQRLVIDTKFTSIFGKGWYRDQSLKTGCIYQLYAYLRSQEGRGDPWAEQASGMLLHPAIRAGVDEAVLIQGHRMRFATVDLAGEHTAIRQRLLQLVNIRCPSALPSPATGRNGLWRHHHHQEPVMAPATPDLERFHQAQDGGSGPGFVAALREIQAGRKVSHWIWYVLPQLAGLGHSAMAQRYGIADLAEAQAYLADAVLGPRLAEITVAIAKQLQAGVTLTALLGDLDARKAVSSLTLFERAARGTPGGGPWICSFLAGAVTVLTTAEAQGLPRCPLTVARLEVGPSPCDPPAPGP